MKIMNILLIFVSLVATVSASNFLFVSGPFVASHAASLHTVTKALVKSGHRATSIHVAEEDRPGLENLGKNHTEIVVYLDNANNDLPMVSHEKNGRIRHPQEAYWNLGESIRGILSHPSPSPMLREYCKVLLRDIRPRLEQEKFDLVVVEALHNECGVALAFHLKAKVLLSIHTGSGGTNLELTTADTNVAYIPSIFTGLTENMSFWDRVMNIVTLGQTQLFLHHFMSVSDSVIREYIPHVPSIPAMLSEIDGGFFNMHYVLDYPRPLPPTFVCAGGIQIRENHQNLTQELEQFIKKSPSGIILVSFGSILKLESFPTEVLKNLFEALIKLGPNIVVRTKTLPKSLSLSSSRVLMREHLPQQALLADNRTRLFVTHGGSKGVLEAIFHGVPMAAMAVFGDQVDVVAKIVHRGIGRAIDKKHDANQMFNVMKDVLENPKYREETERRGRLMRADPQSPLESVLSLINFVLETNGADHMKIASRNLNWLQIHSLDVFLFIFLVFATFFYVSSVILVKCCKNATSKRPEDGLEPKKKRQ